MMFASLAVWLNLASLRWINMQHSSRTIGEILAIQILVQQPWQMFNQLMHVGIWALHSLVFFDYSFEVGPVVVFYVFAAGEVAMSALYRKRYGRPRPEVSTALLQLTQIQSQDVKIELNKVDNRYNEDDMHQVEMSFEQKMPPSPRAKAEPSSEGLSDMAVQAKILSKYTSVNHALQSDTLAPQQEAALKRVKQLFLREDAEPLRSEFITPRKPTAASKQAKDNNVTVLASSRSPRNSSPTRPRSGTLQPKATASPRSGSFEKKLTQNSSQLNPNTILDKIKRTRQARQEPSTSKNINTDAKSAADRGLVSPRYSSRSTRGTKKTQSVIKTVVDI